MSAVSILGTIVVIGSILLSMTLHEAMHAYVSNWLGDDTAMRLGRLTLNPLAHIDLFSTILLPVLLYLAGLPPFGAAKPVPFNPYRVRYGDFGAALVGIAGPMTNLVLAVVVGLWTRFVVGFNAGFISEMFVIFVVVNLAFFVFNMIPWPPLDGSRLLYAFAPEPLQRLMKQIESFGLMGIFLFMLLAFQFLLTPVGKAIDLLASFIFGIPFHFG